MATLIESTKAVFSGIPRTVWLLSFAQLINRSGTMVVFFLSVYLKDDIGLSLKDVGLIMACFGIGTLTGVFVGGKLVDRIGYYPVMLWSLLLGSILFVMVSFIRDPAILGIAMFSMSAIGEAFRPANMAAISIYSPPEIYTRSITLNRLAVNLGFSIGPAFGGLLAIYSYQYIFWADGLSCFLAAIILLLFVKRKRNVKAQSLTEPNIHSVLHSPYKDKWFLFFLPISALYAIAFFQFFSTMPIYFKEVEHFTESEIGLLMGFNGLLVALFEMVLIYRYEKATTLYNFIFIGALLLALSYIAMLFVSGFWWIFILIAVISFSEMFAMPFMNTFMNNRAFNGKRGEYSSLYIMSWSSAQILTPIIATSIISQFGYSILWLVFAGFSLITMIGIKWLEKQVSNT